MGTFFFLGFVGSGRKTCMELILCFAVKGEQSELKVKQIGDFVALGFFLLQCSRSPRVIYTGT